MCLFIYFLSRIFYHFQSRHFIILALILLISFLVTIVSVVGRGDAEIRSLVVQADLKLAM